MSAVSSYFKINEKGSTVPKEVLGGATTFMTLAYIVFVQPVVLSAAGMNFGAVFSATCYSSAIACFIMGLYANYPVALAPAMGHNFYFAFAVILGMHVPWERALGIIAVAGIIFFIISLTNLRQTIMEAIPDSLGAAIACGIGLLIALVGFEWSGIIVSAPGTYVGLGNLKSPPVLLALFGLLMTASLAVRQVKGAILIGIISSTIVGLITGIITFGGVVSAPPSMMPTFFKADFSGLFSVNMIVIIGIFLFLDIFDTIGTLVGLAPEAGFMKDGRPDISKKAFLADSGGTVIGAFFGTSTVTSYVESSAGINAGARTGLAAVVTGIFFLVTPFFSPIVKMVGGGISISEHTMLYPITAPALIIIGVMMMKSALRIDWKSPENAIPAFLTIMVMQLSVSITDGIAFGFISYSVLSVFSGKFRRVSPAVHVIALLLLIRYAFFMN